MKRSMWNVSAFALLCCLTGGVYAAENKAEAIFNGKDLTGWDGNPDFWHVEDGNLVGQTTKEKPTKGNTFLIWRGGTVENFEIEFDYKLDNHNSGLQYRSFEVPGNKWVVGGYQADIDDASKYTGILYGEKDRGILCERGKKVTVAQGGKPQVTGELGKTEDLLKHIKKGDWNHYRITAKGNHLVHEINGVVMADITDEDTVVTEPGKKGARTSGILAFQLHAGPPMKVSFKNITLKKLD